jgi:hypothetical protein
MGTFALASLANLVGVNVLSIDKAVCKKGIASEELGLQLHPSIHWVGGSGQISPLWGSAGK